MGKLTQFKYEQLDELTADFLRQKESNMRDIIGKAYTEYGTEYKKKDFKAYSLEEFQSGEDVVVIY